MNKKQLIASYTMKIDGLLKINKFIDSNSDNIVITISVLNSVLQQSTQLKLTAKPNLVKH